jgi:SCP-2 sterol transfer family
MGLFSDPDELYAHLGRLFVEAAADEELGPRLAEANTILQLRLRDPDAVVTVKVLQAEERQVDLGDTTLRPEVVLAMDADVAHGLWLGTVNITVALARGHIVAQGPVAKVLKVVPLTRLLAPRYRALLEGAGREDLVAAA